MGNHGVQCAKTNTSNWNHIDLVVQGLLEKCFAKQAGSYMALKGFDSKVVYRALTGVQDKGVPILSENPPRMGMMAVDSVSSASVNMKETISWTNRWFHIGFSFCIWQVFENTSWLKKDTTRMIAISQMTTTHKANRSATRVPNPATRLDRKATWKEHENRAVAGVNYVDLKSVFITSSLNFLGAVGNFKI